MQHMSCLKKKEYKNWNTGTSFSKNLVIDKDVTVNKDIAENLNSLFTKNWIYFGSEHSNKHQTFHETTLL